MGTPYRYAPWQPITVNGTAPFAKPMYYGNLFVATALANGLKRVVSLVNETTFTAYGIYGGADGPQELESVAVVNMQMWNSTQGAAGEQRPYATVELPGLGDSGTWEGAEVRRLTAPGAEVKNGVTFAGRTVGGDGTLVGQEQVEAVVDGISVEVGAGEAVLVTRSYSIG